MFPVYNGAGTDAGECRYFHGADQLCGELGLTLLGFPALLLHEYAGGVRLLARHADSGGEGGRGRPATRALDVLSPWNAVDPARVSESILKRLRFNIQKLHERMYLDRVSESIQN